MSGDLWTGGCQCGEVRFRASSLGRATFCNCRMCQKAMGGIGGAFVVAKNVTWLGAEPKRYRSSNKVERGFCGACGTPLTFETAHGIDIAIAAFDRAGDIAPVVQFDRAHRLPWADGLRDLPAPDEAERGRITAWQADIVSKQHPDSERR